MPALPAFRSSAHLQEELWPAAASLRSSRERSLFFSFGGMNNIPSAGEREYQEASVKRGERKGEREWER